MKAWYVKHEGAVSTLRGPYKHAETAGAVRAEIERAHPDKDWNLQIVYEDDVEGWN